MIRFALCLLIALLLSACAGPGEKAQFRLGLDPSAEVKRLTWPPESSEQVPRYFYVGELVGDPNFVKPEPGNKQAKNIFALIVGLLIGEDPPLIMDRPQSGAVDEKGRIFVTDIGRAGVFVFDETQNKSAFWDRADELTPFVTPVAIAVGPEGQIFVSDAELGLVARLDVNGKFMPSIGKGQLSRPTGLVFDVSTRRLYVADTPEHQIKVFDLEGQLLATIGAFGEGPGELNYPTHLSLADGKLYVSDTLNARIQVFSTLDGKQISQVGKRGNYIGNMVRPKGVATDSEHNIYVIESNHDYLLVYNRRGEFLMAIGGVGGGPGNFHLPAGVWTDSHNRIFVADMLNSRVSVFQFLGGDMEDVNE